MGGRQHGRNIVDCIKMKNFSQKSQENARHGTAEAVPTTALPRGYKARLLLRLKN